MQDVVRRVITSSLPIGAKTKGWPGLPDGHWRCARSCCRGASAPEETLEHAYHECATVARFLRAAIDRWNAHTGETLDCTDRRVTMLGDRGLAARAATEEPWRVLHAVLLYVIHATGSAAKSATTDETSPTSMLRRARRELTRVARMRWRTLNAQARTSQFNSAWSLVCDVRRQGALVVHVLDDIDPAVACDDAQPVKQIYTDGSMRRGERNARAGWAFVVSRVQGARAPNLRTSASLVEFAECGNVVTLPCEGGYDGATRQTNNTAELTALLRAVRYEAACPDKGAVRFCVDSTYAINVAFGRWHNGAKNRELGRRLREAYARLCTVRGHSRVRLRHVRSHTRDAGNEAADRVAKDAASGALTGGGPDVLRRARDVYEEIRPPGPEDASDGCTKY